MYSPKASDFANIQYLVILTTLILLIGCTLLMKPQPLRTTFAGDPASPQGEPIALTK